MQDLYVKGPFILMLRYSADVSVIFFRRLLQYHCRSSWNKFNFHATLQCYNKAICSVVWMDLREVDPVAENYASRNINLKSRAANPLWSCQPAWIGKLFTKYVKFSKSSYGEKNLLDFSKQMLTALQKGLFWFMFAKNSLCYGFSQHCIEVC